MWNPAGFPILEGDEGIYVQRSVGILNHEVLYGLHDHPFFGQTVLAGFMYVSGYPGLLDDPPADPSHVEAFYAYPRAFMGLLAVLDTLLVYLIADRMFGRRVAAVAAVIFAVAPMSLMLRMVLLDSILLPFVLASVLLALHSRGSDRRHLLLLASGACLGLAIFTKVPAAAMIPPCAILAYSASRRIRDAGLWLAPALAIPAVWPAYAAQAGQFDAWIRDVAWQAGRSNAGLPETVKKMFGYDPVLTSLGMAGFAFAMICLALRLGRGTGRRERQEAAGQVIRRTISGGAVRACSYWKPGTVEPENLGFLAVWFSSILLFFGAIGFAKVYHMGTLFPALCITAAVLILWAGGRLTRGAGRERMQNRTCDRTVLIAVAGIGLAGLLTTGVIVHFDAQTPEWEALSFLLQNYSDDPDTVKAVYPTSRWLLLDVYGLQNTASFYTGPLSPCPLHIPNVSGLQNTTDLDYCKKHLRGALGTTDLTIQDAAGFSDHYVQPDAERVVLVIGNSHKKHFVDAIEACDYAADSASMPCHTAYGMMRLYNDGTLIKGFANEMSTDAFPSLPHVIERHLINQYEIVEWIPAK